MTHWPLFAAAFGTALAAWPCIARHDRQGRARRAAARKDRAHHARKDQTT